MAGTWGIAGERLVEATPRARMRPVCTCGSADGMLSKRSRTLPWQKIGGSRCAPLLLGRARPLNPPHLFSTASPVPGGRERARTLRREDAGPRDAPCRGRTSPPARCGRAGRMRDEHVRGIARQCHRREIALEVVSELRIGAHADGVRGDCGHDGRVAVGRCLRGGFHAEVTAGARPLLTDDLLSPTFGELLTDGAGQKVASASPGETARRFGPVLVGQVRPPRCTGAEDEPGRKTPGDSEHYTLTLACEAEEREPDPPRPQHPQCSGRTRGRRAVSGFPTAPVSWTSSRAP